MRNSKIKRFEVRKSLSPKFSKEHLVGYFCIPSYLSLVWNRVVATANVRNIMINFNIFKKLYLFQLWTVSRCSYWHLLKAPIHNVTSVKCVSEFRVAYVISSSLVLISLRLVNSEIYELPWNWKVLKNNLNSFFIWPVGEKCTQ